MKHSPRFLTLLAPLLALGTSALQGGQPKPVPRVQAVPLPQDQVAFECDRRELTRLYFSQTQQRPYLFPINGPSGYTLTRLGHPHDPISHSHHNSVWISHADINGTSFWADTSGARIIHQRVEKLTDGESAASVETSALWRNKEGFNVLKERRTVSVEPLENGEWLLRIDLQLTPEKDAVQFGDTAFGMIGVRMAKTIGVKDGGGTIRNSENGIDESGCFRKKARWVDYSGPVTNSVQEGITLFDHPANHNHPVPFHVRDDGWMGAALSFGNPLSLAPGQTLRLRYALYIHSGSANPENIERRWKAFAAAP
jgi:hypothetical protein